jgi:hypothetical protein
MSVLFLHNDQAVASISSGAVRVFLSITRLVQSELDGMSCGFSPIVSDEILIDRECFVKFVDEFFRRAEHSGKFKYFTQWAEEIAGMYENVTGTTPSRKILGIDHFQPVRYR